MKPGIELGAAIRIVRCRLLLFACFSFFATNAGIAQVTGSFVSTGSLNPGRVWNTSTLLTDGTVLIAGGEDINGNALTSAELYNPVTGTFAYAGNLNTARSLHTATLLNNGLVLIVGGYDSNGNPLASAELYNPAKGTFTPTGSLNIARSYNTQTLLKNGTVLIAGGTDLNAPLASAELYNPNSGTFSLTSNLTTAREAPLATLLNNGMVLIVGGLDADDDVIPSAELYDPATGTFTLTGTPNAGHVQGAATLLNGGMVLIEGGYDTIGNVLASAELYDPATAKFTLTGSLSTELNQQSATLLSNGMVLIAGGFDSLGTSSVAELYNPATGSFIPTGGLNTARADQTTTLLSNGMVLVAGGDNNSGNVANAELYEPATLTPSNLVSISLSPAAPTLAVGGVQRFIATGTFGDSSTQTLASVTWSSSSGGVATITNDVTDLGAAFATGAGSTTIEACAGPICGSTVLTVPGTPVTLVSIAVTPANPSILSGTTEQFMATGTYSDNSTQNLTNIVTWSSSTTTVATISGGGLAAGAGTGSATIQASSGNISGSTLLTVTAPAVTLQSIAVSPANASIALSGTQQYTAMGSYSDTSTQDLTSSVTWSSTAPTVATISSTGLANASGLGQTTIQAVFSSVSGSATLTVTPGFVLTGSLNTARYIQSATLLNTGMVLISGGYQSGVLPGAELYNPPAGTFTPTGTLNTARYVNSATLLNNGMVLIAGGYDNSDSALASAEFYNPVTGTFTFTGSLNTARGSHTATLLNNGLVLITGGGGSSSAWSSAELYNPATGMFTNTGSLNIPRANHTATLLNNGMVLIAGGVDSNNNSLANAELYDPATGTFSPTGNLNIARYYDTATLLNNGKVLITGGYDSANFANPPSFGNLSSAELFDPVTGTFTSTGSLGAAFSQATATLLNNGMVLIAGYGSYSGSPVSAELYDPTVGTFTPTGSLNYPRLESTATLLNNGKVLLAGGFFGGGLASAELYETSILTPPNLVSISLSPTNPTVSPGASQRFIAVGTFSDSSTETLASVTWSSSNNAIATVTNDASNLGAGFGVSPGTAAVSACTGSVCGSTVLTVSPPTLVSLAITPANPSTPLGLAQRFAATGTYSDGSTQDLTSTAAWSSSAPTVSTVTAGLASALTQGSASISAILGSASATTTLTVGPPQIASNAITPANTSVALGQSVQFSAISVYTDGSTQPFTGVLRWISSDPTVATFDSNGLASTVDQGTVSVSVFYLAGSMYRPLAATAFTVGPPLLLSLVVAPASASILPGTTQQFTATGIYTNGPTDLTSMVTWSSSAPLVASISNTSGRQGLATGNATGVATFTAALGAGTSAAQTTVTVNYGASGSLNVARYGHTATLLLNGKVLITGGFDGVMLASAELYDPATGIFTPTGSLNTARVYHTATLLNNGRVLIVGGSGPNGAINSAELYDPSIGSFTPTGNLSIQRYSHTATLLNGGNVLIVGGENGELYGSVGQSELYDPGTGNFVSSPFYLQVENHTATLLNDGRVLIAGGINIYREFDEGYCGNNQYGCVYTFYENSNQSIIFDPLTLATTSIAGLSPRYYHTATLLSSGQVLLAGGYTVQNVSTGAGTCNSSAQLFDPVAQAFTPTGTMSVPHCEDTPSLLNGGQVLISGGDSGSGSLALTAVAEVYDPVAGSFTPTVSLPNPLRLQTATLLANGQVLLAGGLDDPSTLASAQLYVPPAPNLQNLVSITLSPSSATVPVGTAQHFAATGTFSDGSTSVLSSVFWNSADSTIATSTNDATNSGSFYGLEQATTTASACVGTICGSTTVTFGPPILAQITISPTQASIPLGTTQQYIATGIYSDGSTQDLNGQVSWSSLAPTVASIGAGGLATSLSQGFAIITASLGARRSSGVALSVNAPALASIAVAPASPSIAAGLTQQFTATGTFTDGSTQDLTSSATWSSSVATVASVASGGLASSFLQGSTVISATFNSIAGSTTLSVLPPALVALSIAPLNPVILPGSTQQFSATGLFTDGSTPNLTASVIWASSPTNVATISNAAGSQGLATGTTTGIASMTATMGAVSSSSTLTVNFSGTGSLITARSGQTVTVLNNGMVLVAGGDGGLGGLSGGSPLSSAELYNPTTGTFASTGNLTVPREFHSATLLNNGMVLIAGGQDSNGIPASAELYNPATGAFTTTGSLLRARVAHTATLLSNGQVLIAGGYGAANEAELYDPTTGTFTATGNLTTPRWYHTATLLNNGMVLLAGGTGTNGSGPVFYLDNAELYNPATQTFTVTGNLNAGRQFHTANLLNKGLVLITGGLGNIGPLGSAELYNVSTGAFAPTATLSTPRIWHTAALLNDGMVLVAGGSADTQCCVLSTAELFDPVLQTFSLTGGLSVARVFQGAALLNNGEVLYAGGLSAGNFNMLSGSLSAALASAELYLPPSQNLPSLVSIGLTPSNPVVLVGGSQTFVATGTFSDSSTQSLQSVTWRSSNTAVASVTNDSSNRGTAFAFSGGTTNVTACAGSICGSTTLNSVFPVASLSTSSLSFANQNVGTSSVAQVVTLTNTGTGAMAITALGITGTNSGDFSQANNCPVSPATLAPGANCMFSVKFTPTATGSRAASISITDNAAGSPQSVLLSGNGTLPSITLTPATLAFGNQVINTTSTAKTITLSNPGSGTLAISSIAVTGANLTEFAETNTCGSNVGSSGTCTISVTFTPATGGAKTASVTVTDNSAGSPHSVSLTGTGILPFTATPNPLAFGSQGVNSTSAAKNVTLTNNTSAAVTILSSTISGTNAADFAKSATTCGASLASKANCTISIGFTPSITAAETATLTITDSAANSPQAVSLTGTGVAQATTSVAALAFGNQGLSNTSAAKTVTLTNNDTAAISLSGNTISGTNASAFAVSATTCGTSLAGHTSCTISVTFSPATTGAMTATLSVADIASNSPQTVSLTGTGVQPVTLSVATVAFGNQGIASTSAAKTVTVTNNNSVGLTFSSIAIAPPPGDFVQSATTCSASIAAHSSCTVSVTYNPSVLGAETATLTLTDSAGNSPQNVSLTGTGVAQFTLSAASITFANQAFGTTSTAKNVTLTNNTSGAVAFSSITIGGTNPSNFTQSATTCGASLNGHSSCTLSFTFSPSAAVSYSATGNIADGASNSPQTISLTGTGIVPVSVTPATLVYANQTVGTTSGAKTVTVKNNLPGTLTNLVFSFTGTNAGDFLQSATTCTTSLASGSSCTVSIEFKPSATGARSALLSISDGATTSPQSVSLSGTGK